MITTWDSSDDNLRNLIYEYPAYTTLDGNNQHQDMSYQYLENVTTASSNELIDFDFSPVSVCNVIDETIARNVKFIW